MKLMNNEKIVVTLEDMEIRSEEIFELCETINQPIFIQRNEKNNLVLMSLKYYKEQHFDDIWSIHPC